MWTLATKLSVLTTDQASMSGIGNWHIAEIEQSCADNALAFWAAGRSSYKVLAPLAGDLLTASASQAFVERIFSLCGLLTSGRRSRTRKS